MEPKNFDHILSLIREHISKTSVMVRDPIPPEIKLAITHFQENTEEKCCIFKITCRIAFLHADWLIFIRLVRFFIRRVVPCRHSKSYKKLSYQRIVHDKKKLNIKNV